MAKEFIKGNHAIAEAAIRSGCRFYSGYPITPQSEILEYLSWRMDEVGGRFVQCESELSAVSMCYGAAAAGARALLSSSGPGFDLFQEGISYIASAELPAVIVDVARYGSGLGQIVPGQSDYLQAVKNGGHGDYRCIVLAPSTIQNSIELMDTAFELAEKYRNPVIILTDGAIGQMMEAVELPEMKEYNIDSREYALRGCIDPKKRKIATTRDYFDIPRAEYGAYLRRKIAEMSKEAMYEEFETEDAEIVLVAYGITCGACHEACMEFRRQGMKVGLIRPVTLWPFPKEPFKKLKNVKKIISVEMTALPQLAEDVALSARGVAPVYPLCVETDIVTDDRILAFINEIDAGKAEEV